MNEKVAEAILYTPGCFRTTSHDPFITAGRKISPYYIDMRVIPSFPKQFKIVIEEMTDLIDGSNEIGGNLDKLATSESAGIPFCSAVGYELDVGIVYVRKESKGYGLGKQIEGSLVKGEDTVGLDDLTTEGINAVKVINSVRSVGANIKDYCVGFDRNQGASKVLSDLNVKLHALANMSPEFVELALRNDRITKDDTELFEVYSENTDKWSREYVVKNPEFLKRKISNVVKDGKITDMAPLEVLTVGHPELKTEYEPLVKKWLAELGVRHNVPEFNYKINEASAG